MSRIGKSPVKLPSGVTVKMNGTVMEVTGPKGSLKRDTFGRVALKSENNQVTLEAKTTEDDGTKFWGLYRTLLSNMVHGVSAGFTRELELHGVGYRAAVQGKNLNLTVGYSHPVSLEPPAGITFQVDAKSGKVMILGCDKEVVGQVASKVRAIRPPEPYHGKGIRYAGERIVQKVGKSAAKK